MIAEQHIMEDLGRIPSFADWVRNIRPEPWMGRIGTKFDAKRSSAPGPRLTARFLLEASQTQLRGRTAMIHRRSARERLPCAALTDIRSVPAVRATPYLDTLCRRHTAFPSFLALLTAAGGYRPSIRLDLTGPEGGTLARAYDAWQTRWGDPRRAYVWPAP